MNLRLVAALIVINVVLVAAGHAIAPPRRHVAAADVTIGLVFGALASRLLEGKRAQRTVTV